jgi:CRISPR-associated endonuclease/helicase Cas3
MSFAELFFHATQKTAYEYQCRLACGDEADPTQSATLTTGTECASRLISIPTGLGKTAAATLAWFWNRIVL